MRIFLVGLGLLLVTAPWVSAQVTAEIVTDEDQFLRNEPIPVKVRISNLSGQTLRLGNEPDWLMFTVENREGHVVARLAEPQVAGEFTLESAFKATKRVDLTPYFDLSQPGHYEITATVKIPKWDQPVTTKPKVINVSMGAKIWEKIVGVPYTGDPPETRKYSLVQTSYQERLRMYARVTNESESIVYNVVQLGPAVSFCKPEHQLDRLSNLHVLFQDGARTFNYSVIKPNGAMLVRQTYAYLRDSRPVLRGDKEGFIEVGGGQRVISKNDLPSATVSTNEVRTPKP